MFRLFRVMQDKIYRHLCYTKGSLWTKDHAAGLCCWAHLFTICDELCQLVALLSVILSTAQESERFPDGADALGLGSGVVRTGALTVVALRRVQV